jgi:cysteine desulfurase
MSVELPIYLDNHATTRVDPRVVDAMLPYFTAKYGNAASRHHAFGRVANEAVQAAREQIARLLGASAREIIFTSGATESNNLAIRGVASMYRNRGDHIITASTEHHAVLDPCLRLGREGLQVTVLPVASDGRVDPQQLCDAITERTILVSIMAANNEIGTLAPLKEIGQVCKKKGVLLHTDVVQALGKTPFDVEDLGIDLASVTAHKLYGPKGVGALYVRRREPHVRLTPLFDGGGHEQGLRSGTLPVPSIVGFGKACELCQHEGTAEAERLLGLRERLREGIQSQLEEIRLNGHPTVRLPGNLNLSFGYVEGEALMMSMRDIAVSSGSACTSASVEPSYVLRAIGLSDELARSSLRFGLGRFNTVAEIDFTIETVVQAVKRLRAISPGYALAKGNSRPSGRDCAN